MRINKLLSNYGVCSRKEANRIIEEGRVIVNGELAFPGQWVEEYDDILLDGEKLKQKERIYIALNKPVGITCTAANDVEDNVIQYMNYPEYIFPVGRLDKPSQGLILMTNDGDLANGILEADNNKEKEYIVTVDKEFDDKFIESMSRGVDIGGVVTRPCKVTRVNKDTFNIILTQGLNKQIRRMSKAFGFNVIKLDRIRIMNIKVDGIEYGKWRNLTEEEIRELRENTK
ncbi:Ribosomal large subunit pseudouridine synthase F [uncultured Clostridium sp.]|uniref:pseudouridine synthase n=1 Tax=uncultured Clostridium sp. TaxID=59620 RepID=UPI000820B8A0|nr:pseudouridine synthase [uncultured Clostridium sp.]SCI79435.1 Ribosomal large subunit pseudouridine synthase F [uncultured Clostridium sp.]